MYLVAWLTVSAGLNDEVNPIAALAELLTDSRFGAGRPSSALDTVGWMGGAERQQLRRGR